MANPELEALVDRASVGDHDALNALMPVVYRELRRLAARYVAREHQAQSVQATMLVNEAYLRLFRDEHLRWQNRSHFLAIAATVMREILVERARARQATKRGGQRARVTLDEAAAVTRGPAIDILALHEALERLATLDAEQARLVELRFFAGLTVEEIAALLQLSPATVKRRWTAARAWLRGELKGTPGGR